MPLVQFDLPRPLFEEKGTEISEEVHLAFIDALDIPPDDKFQIFRPREQGRARIRPVVRGRGPQGSDGRFRSSWSIATPWHSKRELYRALVTRLGKIGVRPEDIQIAITENGYEDWYAGRLAGD